MTHKYKNWNRIKNKTTIKCIFFNNYSNSGYIFPLILFSPALFCGNWMNSLFSRFNFCCLESADLCLKFYQLFVNFTSTIDRKSMLCNCNVQFIFILSCRLHLLSTCSTCFCLLKSIVKNLFKFNTQLCKKGKRLFFTRQISLGKYKCKQFYWFIFAYRSKTWSCFANIHCIHVSLLTGH